MCVFVLMTSSFLSGAVVNHEVDTGGRRKLLRLARDGTRARRDRPRAPFRRFCRENDVGCLPTKVFESDGVHRDIGEHPLRGRRGRLLPKGRRRAWVVRPRHNLDHVCSARLGSRERVQLLRWSRRRRHGKPAIFRLVLRQKAIKRDTRISSSFCPPCLPPSSVSFSSSPATSADRLQP